MNLPTYNIDFQPYLLPQTDPWSLPPEKAIQLLQYLENRCIRKVFCTPPVKQDNPDNSIEFLQNTFLDFCKSHTGSVEFKLAARYRLDDGFEELVSSRNLLAVGEGMSELIIDVSPLNNNPDTWQLIHKIIAAGYTPVVVQPERTTYWDMEDFHRLKKMGCKFMLNLYSLFGYNGDTALMHSRTLLDEEMYSYLFSGIEDTKVMRYSETFNLNEGDTLLKKISKLEENGRHLWSAT